MIQSRPSRTKFVDYSIFDIRDNKTGRMRCRWCGALVFPPHRSYCCTEHGTNFYHALSWKHTRKAIWKRDDETCQICRTRIKFNSNCEIHHIIPVQTLKMAAFMAVRDIEDHEEHARAYKVIMMLLYFDWNNLITYCAKCHTIWHSSLWRKGKIPSANYTRFLANFRAFQKLNERLRVQRALDEFEAFKKLILSAT